MEKDDWTYLAKKFGLIITKINPIRENLDIEIGTFLVKLGKITPADHKEKCYKALQNIDFDRSAEMLEMFTKSSGIREEKGEGEEAEAEGKEKGGGGGGEDEEAKEEEGKGKGNGKGKGQGEGKGKGK